jgi:hypothetical protein
MILVFVVKELEDRANIKKRQGSMAGRVFITQKLSA